MRGGQRGRHGAKPLTIIQHHENDPPGSIAAVLTDLGMPFEVRRPDQGDGLPVRPDESGGIISLGGAMHVTQADEYPFLAEEIALLRRMLDEEAPLWGICLGAQLLCLAGGGEVFERPLPELGWTAIDKLVDDPLLEGLESPFTAFNWHSYSCRPGSTSHLLATADDGGVQAFRVGASALGTQFHPEVDEDMAPYWVERAVLQHPHMDATARRILCEETARRLPDYPAFCRRIATSFLRATCLLPK